MGYVRHWLPYTKPASLIAVHVVLDSTSTAATFTFIRSLCFKTECHLMSPW
jgi:hypothetical protein